MFLSKTTKSPMAYASKSKINSGIGKNTFKSKQNKN
jgi:hypothetical protein